MTYRTIRYEAAGGVATVTLNRPDVLNAMNEPMRVELTGCFDALAEDETVRVVVVTGAGERAFSAGADIRAFVEPEPPVRFREQRRRVDVRQAMDRCPSPSSPPSAAGRSAAGSSWPWPATSASRARTPCSRSPRSPSASSRAVAASRAWSSRDKAPELARAMAARAPAAKGLASPLADGLKLEHDLATLLRTTEDRLAGARGFLEKRPPRWTGR